MIFLAVTLGFIAENVRESIGDRSKEKNLYRIPDAGFENRHCENPR